MRRPGVSLVEMLGTLALTGMVSAGSLAGAVVITAMVWALDVEPILRIIITIVAAIVVIRHRSNIQRILAGTENRFGPARRPEAEEPPSQ